MGRAHYGPALMDLSRRRGIAHNGGSCNRTGPFALSSCAVAISGDRGIGQNSAGNALRHASLIGQSFQSRLFAELLGQFSIQLKRVLNQAVNAPKVITDSPILFVGPGFREPSA